MSDETSASFTAAMDAAVTERLSARPGYTGKSPIGWNWNPDGRVACQPGHLPLEVITVILRDPLGAESWEDSLGEIYPWTANLDPGEQLTCTHCGEVIYAEPPCEPEDE